MRTAFTASVLLLLFSFSVPSFATSTDKKVEKYFAKAENYLRKSDWLRAIPNLRECVNLRPEEAKYAFMLGKCYVNLNRNHESLPYFAAAYRVNPEVDLSLNFYLAKAFHANYRFDKAEKHIKDYLETAAVDDPLYAEAEALLKQCAIAREFMDNEQNFRVENLGEFVNTRYPDYAASFADNYNFMTFTSRRPRSFRKLLYGLNHTEDIDEEIYQSSYYEGLWSMTKLFRKPVNKFRNDASVFISEDGNTIIYFVDKQNGDLYSVTREGQGWSKPVPLGSNINSPGREPSVFLCDFGNTLYFSSDRPGGQGGLDLYMVKKVDEKTWGPAENMGEKFNSTMDEDAPFVSADGNTLYFSSRGPKSMGGFDIFKCQKQPDGTWGAPENLGYPINSVADDIYYVSRTDNKGFYYSSNRQGGYGDMDLYFGYGYTPDPVVTKVVGQLFDSLNNRGVAAKVRLIDPATGKVVAEAPTDASGNYALEVPSGKNNKQYKMDIKFAGEKPKPAATAVFSTGKANVLVGRVIDGVTGEPLKASIELLDPQTGAILDAGISNQNSGRYFVPITSGKEYQIRVKAPDYISYFEDLKVNASGVIEAHSFEITLQPVNDANKIVLNWQFFDYGKWEMKNIYSDDIDNLITVMQKVPVLRIRIVGHTDWDGSQKYNQELSEKRAKAVAEFMVSKGIDKNRIETAGKGELQPMYDNKNEKLKPWNRRVELFILN